MSILSDRTDKARFAEAPIPFLISVALVAAVNVVLSSIASISLLGAGKETLTQSRSQNSHLEAKVVGALVSHVESNASPVQAQTKSPSARSEDTMSSSTPTLLSSGLLTEKTLVAPAQNPKPDGEASTTAVETSNGSTRAPSTAPEISRPQEVRTPPALLADAANPAQDASGATIPAEDEGSAAFAPEFDFSKETQIKESTGFAGSSPEPEAKPPVRHAAPRGRGAKAGNIADKLNRAELSYLVQRSRVLR